MIIDCILKVYHRSDKFKKLEPEKWPEIPLYRVKDCKDEDLEYELKIISLNKRDGDIIHVLESKRFKKSENKKGMHYMYFHTVNYVYLEETDCIYISTTQTKV